MAYAQTNYGQLQGKTVNGVKPKYSIHDIGCFITAFCNLLQRFGTNISPDQIDNQLAARSLYIDVDDGIYDDVGWSTICSFDPSIAIVQTGNGAPASDNSIVKFVYYSSRLGTNTTHFSLVHSASQGLIIDSWDGVIKHWSVYGGPKAFATYTKSNPQPVQTVQGVEMFNNDQEVQEAYLFLRGDPGTPEERKGWIGQSKQRFFQVGKGEADDYRRERDDLRNQLNSVKQALANEQAKPPVEVVKEVVKIVEKPIEVVKEVPVYTHDQETKNMITSIFNYFAGQFKTFSKYIKK